MHISERHMSASIAAVVITTVVVQSFGSVQAQPKGYVQADCPNIVKQAIDTVSAQCGKMARSKLCYGNSNITAQFQPGANNIHFSAPGDTVDVSAIKQFTLGGMDTAANSWGVAEMKIKADLPDADPSQAVTMILFGDVQLTDASNDANTAILTQTPGAIAHQNQYATATTRAIDTRETQSAATATKITGLEATATAYALIPTLIGTVPALKATQAAATATKLAAYENTATAAPAVQTSVPGGIKGSYSGLQAFYFQSNDTAPCDQAPHDGILIQSPQGSKQRVTLVIDGATITLGSTVYITAQPGKYLTINTLEGSATVFAVGQTFVVGAGTATTIPLDANLHASGVPTFPDFYAADTIRQLPTAPLPDKARTFIAGLPADITFSNWSGSRTLASGNCNFIGQNATFVSRIAYNDSQLWYNPGAVLTKTTNGDYSEASTIVEVGRPVTNFTVFTLSVIDSDHMTGTSTSTETPGTTCSYKWDFVRSGPDATASATPNP